MDGSFRVKSCDLVWKYMAHASSHTYGRHTFGMPVSSGRLKFAEMVLMHMQETYRKPGLNILTEYAACVVMWTGLFGCTFNKKRSIRFFVFCPCCFKKKEDFSLALEPSGINWTSLTLLRARCQSWMSPTLLRASTLQSRLAMSALYSLVFSLGSTGCPLGHKPEFLFMYWFIFSTEHQSYCEGCVAAYRQKESEEHENEGKWDTQGYLKAQSLLRSCGRKTKGIKQIQPSPSCPLRLISRVNYSPNRAWKRNNLSSWKHLWEAGDN